MFVGENANCSVERCQLHVNTEQPAAVTHNMELLEQGLPHQLGITSDEP